MSDAIFNFSFLIDGIMRISARARNKESAEQEAKRTFKGSKIKLIGSEFSHNVGDFEPTKRVAIPEPKKEGIDSVVEAYARHSRVEL